MMPVKSSSASIKRSLSVSHILNSESCALNILVNSEISIEKESHILLKEPWYSRIFSKVTIDYINTA